MKHRFATHFWALPKKVAKFDEVFYVKVKKQILATKKPWLATIFFLQKCEKRALCHRVFAIETRFATNLPFLKL